MTVDDAARTEQMFGQRDTAFRQFARRQPKRDRLAHSRVVFFRLFFFQQAAEQRVAGDFKVIPADLGPFGVEPFPRLAPRQRLGEFNPHPLAQIALVVLTQELCIGRVSSVAPEGKVLPVDPVHFERMAFKALGSGDQFFALACLDGVTRGEKRFFG